MKTNHYIVLVVSALFFASCASSPDANQNLAPEDVYGEGTVLSTDAAGTPASKNQVAEIDPYKIANLSISCTTMSGFGMEKKTLSVSFAPKTNDVLYDFSYQGNKMTLTLDAQDRVILLSAIKSYLDEFEAKQLERKGDKDSRYGTINGYISWGVFMKNAEATPKVKVGYEFVDEAPYFIMTFPEADNLIYLKETGSRIKRSGYMRWFMTRSQATEFGNIMDQGFLESTLGEQNVPTASSDPDVY